jgi:hypothetical protein
LINQIHDAKIDSRYRYLDLVFSVYLQQSQDIRKEGIAGNEPFQEDVKILHLRRTKAVGDGTFADFDILT